MKAQQKNGSVVDHDNTTHQNCSLADKYNDTRLKGERVRNKSLLLKNERRKKYVKNNKRKKIYAC